MGIIGVLDYGNGKSSENRNASTDEQFPAGERSNEHQPKHEQERNRSNKQKYQPIDSVHLIHRGTTRA